MKTITRTVWLTAMHFSHMAPGEVHWVLWDAKPNHSTSDVIGSWPHEVTLPLPTDFEPIAAQVRALEAEKAKALEEYQASVQRINDRLGKLLALTNDTEAA